MKLFDAATEAVICQKYLDGRTLQSVGADHNTNHNNIRGVLRRNGHNARSMSAAKRIHTLNESVFDESENNPVAARWVGFLMADGCITRRTNRNVSPEFAVALAEKDRGHLEKFREFLGSSHSIVEYTAKSGHRGVRLSISSRRLVEQLEFYGVKPNKTYGARVERLEKSPAFWAGMVDGDGSISNKDGGKPQLSLLGSKPLMLQYLDFVREVYPKSKSNLVATRGAWQVILSGRAAVAVLVSFRDSNSVEAALERKGFLQEKAILWVSKRPDYSDISLDLLEACFTEHGTWRKVSQVLKVPEASVYRLLKTFRKKTIAG